MRTIAIGVVAAAIGCGMPAYPVGLDERPLNDTCFAPEAFPEDLADTGCFDPDDPSIPGEALVPYAVRVGLWSDGADKNRFLALPDGTEVTFDPEGRAELPPGSVLVKVFRFGEQPIETRLFVRGEDGAFAAATYLWNEAGTQAHLFDGGTVERAGRTWTVPTRDECFDCHDEDAGGVLGLELQQLDGEFTYPETGRTANQLDTLEAIGIAAPMLERPGAYDVEDVRAYLHVNCGHCHRPGGHGAGSFDLRFSTPENLMHVCGERPERGDPTGDNGRLITPGSPEESVLFARMRSVDPMWRMPPLGTAMPDPQGLRLLENWIEQMGDCAKAPR